MIHVKSIQAPGWTVCGKFARREITLKLEDITPEERAKLCPECAKAKQKKPPAADCG